MRNGKETVCAVVVTYNRKNYLLDCLESLKHQSLPPEAILIVDNASSDGTPEVLKKAGYIPEVPVSDTKNTWETHGEVSSPEGEKIKIHYLRLPQNTGGAGGFYHGMKRAYELGYTWIWIMDDDVVADAEALGILKKHSGPSLAMAPAVKTEDGSIALTHRGNLKPKGLFPGLQRPLAPEEYEKSQLYIDLCSFVGLMVRREAISKIGLPIADFFIYADDVEYSLRLSSELGKILLIPASYLIDRNAKKKAGYIVKNILLFKFKRQPISSYWRTYYSLRNVLYVSQKYSRNKAFFYIRVMFHLLKSLLTSFPLILTLDDHKKDRLKIRFLPYIHGLRGVLGKKVEYKNGKIIWH